MASEQPPEQDDSLWDKQLWYPSRPMGASGARLISQSLAQLNRDVWALGAATGAPPGLVWPGWCPPHQ